jgi:oligoribonuclease (3'-5' exoribonuclease)
VSEPSLNLHLIWDDTELDDIDDDIIEEASVVNDCNLQSKGAPKINDFPSTLKTRSSKQTKDTRRNSTTSQPTTSMGLT